MYFPPEVVFSYVALSALAQFALVFLVCTLAEPLVVGHTDGLSLVVVRPSTIVEDKVFGGAAARRRVSRTRRLTLLHSAVSLARDLFRNSDAPVGPEVG